MRAGATYGIDGVLLAHIRSLHEGDARAYHGWSHIEALLSLFDQVERDLHDPCAVHAAILLHDAVYDSRASDNEERSADLAARLLDGILLPVSLMRAIRLIRATAKHAIPPDFDADAAADAALFLDMDLSILGASPAIFDRYEDGVRREYAHVPEGVFRTARADVLERFLGRDPLYFSPWGRARFEAAARDNLRRSIATLRAMRMQEDEG